MKLELKELVGMSESREEIVKRARADLAQRLGVSVDEIEEEQVEEADFPDMALGAPVKGEMSGQMITSGWRIRLKAGARGGYEYRASGSQLRLYNYKGTNWLVNRES
ncbi:MAG TPA: hypothetical protein VF791_05200 [Pyrinomonadaceae bacterium]